MYTSVPSEHVKMYIGNEGMFQLIASIVCSLVEFLDSLHIEETTGHKGSQTYFIAKFQAKNNLM